MGERDSEPERTTRKRSRRITMFVQPRVGLEPEQGRRNLLCVGSSTSLGTEISRLLRTIADPPFGLEFVSDEGQVLEALARARFDALLVEVDQQRTLWRRMTGEHQLPDLPLIALDVASSGEDRSRQRTELLREGASGYILGSELSGPLLESVTFAALERAQMQRALAEVQERFALAVRGSNDGVWEWILDTGEMHFSRRWRELLGYGVDDLANSISEWFERVHPDDIGPLQLDIDAHLMGHKPYHESEHRIRASDGTYRWVISRAVAQREGGRPVRMAGSLTDTSDFRLREQKLREENRLDPLTGLPRREAFLEALTQSIEALRQNADNRYSVLMVDVDRFRWLADSIGHQAADQVLSRLASRLKSCVSEVDTISRFGGDKFVILLPHRDSVEDLSELANRIRAVVHEPFEVEGQTVYTTVSIGMTTSHRHYKDAVEIISDVAAAANKAKERGQDRHEVFETKMRIDALTTLRLEVALRQAVERNEFELHYQPIVELKTGSTVGFEALTRWRHPRRGVVSPGEFIPVAEQTGLIVPIGRWAIHEATRQLGEWQAQRNSSRPMTMSVNLSGRQIADPRLLDDVIGSLRTNQIVPGTFRLELTESVLMDNAETVLRVLNTVRSAGVGVWVDDFGTGYSSLSYLHRFPVDGLKIDKAFVEPLAKMEQDQGHAMIRTILGLADGLNLGVIAEGIETPQQAERLLELGCTHGQGFLYGRPEAPSSRG